jgi:hypothetical protein
VREGRVSVVKTLDASPLGTRMAEVWVKQGDNRITFTYRIGRIYYKVNVYLPFWQDNGIR